MKKRSKNTALKKSPSKLKRFLGFLFFIAILCGVLHYRFGDAVLEKGLHYLQDPNEISTWEQVKLTQTLEHYRAAILKSSRQHKLPPSYFLALITLESSGKKIPNSRFERKIYNRLKDCRDGKTASFGTLKRKRLINLSDGALKNLASSWGPFQLMGYHAYELGIYINDIRGEGAVNFGVKWIDRRYGSYLKKKDYKNAFHIHNTGQPYPTTGKAFTYDPNYVLKGLKYIKYFENELQ